MTKAHEKKFKEILKQKADLFLRTPGLVHEIKTVLPVIREMRRRVGTLPRKGWRQRKQVLEMTEAIDGKEERLYRRLGAVLFETYLFLENHEKRLTAAQRRKLGFTPKGKKL